MKIEIPKTIEDFEAEMWIVWMNVGVMLMWMVLAIFETDKILSKLDLILGMLNLLVALCVLYVHRKRHCN